MNKAKTIKLYTLGEEIFNSVTHGIGSLLSVIGTTLLVTLAALYARPSDVIICLIYGLSLITLYTMSTLYHAFTSDKVKYIFRVIDHSTIFLLIAGSYTPFMLILLRGNQTAALICYLIWGISAVGILLNCISLKKFSKISMVLYILMGWAIVAVFPDVLHSLNPVGFWLLLIGGLSYTFGILFYALNKIRYMHGIWHLFVLAGSIFQYLCVLLYVLPLDYIH